MSFDKPTGGDNSPDRGSEGGDKPFPGAPANREAVDPPEHARTMEDVNAALDRSSNYLEFEAIAKETEPPELYGPRSSDSGSASADSGPGTAEAAADGAGAVPGDGAGVQGEGATVPGTDVSGDRQPEGSPQDDGFARPETFLRPDSELPPFPGAPANREPVEEPTRSRTLDDVNAALDRSSNYLEFEAIAKETDPYAKDASAAKPGDSTPARDVSSSAATADESGERQGEGADGESSEETVPEQPAVRMPQQEMPAAEAPEGEHPPLDGGRTDTVVDGQEAAHHEGPVVLDQGDEVAEAEPAPEGIEPAKDGVVATRSDATAPEADDKPVVEGVVEPGRPEAGPDERDAGDTNATRSEVRLDRQSDDDRSITVAEVKALVAEMRADYEGKLAEQKAEQEARIDSIKADYQAKFDELEARAEGGRSAEDASTERKPASGEASDVSRAEQRGDRPLRDADAPEHVPDDPRIAARQDAMLNGEATREESIARRTSLPRLRGLLTSENISAASTIGGAADTAVQLFGHATPEGMVGLGFTLLGVAGLGLAKMEKRRKEKNDHPD